MKKVLLFLTVVFITAMLIGCKNPINDTPNNNTPNSDTPTSDNPTGESPNTTPPTTQTTEDGLPVNVGVDPFKGNTYEVSSNKLYVFKNDGTYEETYRDDGSLRCIIKYTYNANTKVLARKYYKLPNDEFSFRTATNYDLWTLDECISYLNGLSDEQLASIHRTRRDIAEAIEFLRNIFEEINYVKAEQETYNGNLCLSIREYYTEEESRSLILSEIPHVFRFRTTSNDLWANIGNPAEADGYNIEIGGSALTQTYRITQVTDSTITAIGQNDNVILTLNYAKSWADGVIYLTISGADDVSKGILGNQTFGLSTSTTKEYHPKLTSNNVGTDPFIGNTYITNEDGGQKFVFSSNGTFEDWYFRGGPSGSGHLEMRGEYEYTYDASTKILSYKYKKIPAEGGSGMWTLADTLAWINELPDNVIQQMGTRVELIERINDMFATFGYYKAEEEAHEGNLCLSLYHYYPRNTSLTTNRTLDGIYFDTTGLSVGIYPKQAGDAGYIRIGTSSLTHYSITAITDYSITARIEGGSETISLDYSKSWSNGVVEITVTGADSASQTALGNQSYTLSTTTEKAYYQKQ